MSLSYYLYTLGCKVNSYESASIGVLLSKQGYHSSPSLEEADIIIINTCSVTGRADGKSRQKISSIKKGNPNSIVVVMGCYSQKHAEECLALGGDIILGTKNRFLIPAYLSSYLAKKEKIIDISSSVRNEGYEELGVTSFCENARAYLKIQDGCDNFCTYCHIPLLRGNSRSRDPRQVVEEAMDLCARGYHEIIITGIHIGAYGKDLGDGSFRLPSLLEAILTKCPSLYRLRISSIEESEIDEDFIKLLKKYKNIANHLHIPLQSGSSKILKLMHRHYDADAFLNKLAAIRAVRPDIALTTDVIVGFPLEEERDFLDTMEFCHKAGFAQIHVFPYSPRPSTYAATLKQVAPNLKKDRVHRLMELSSSLWENYLKRFEGQELSILIEDKDPVSHKWRGHSSNYILLEVEGENHFQGEIVSVPYKI